MTSPCIVRILLPACKKNIDGLEFVVCATAPQGTRSVALARAMLVASGTILHISTQACDCYGCIEELSSNNIFRCNDEHNICRLDK